MKCMLIALRLCSTCRYTFLCYTSATKDALTPPALPPALASTHEEYQYLDLVDSLIRTGTFRPDRTGTGETFN